MNEDIGNHTNNHTYLDDYENFDYALTFRLFEYFFNGVLIISLASTFLIMLLITRTKRLKRRILIIFLTWLIWESINVLSAHTLHELIINIFYLLDLHRTGFCLIASFEPWCNLISFLLMFILCSDTIIKSRRVSTKFILITVFLMAVAFIIVKLCLCIFKSNLHIIMLVSSLSFIILLSVVVIKDVVRVYKFAKSKIWIKSSFRMSIARIHTYNWGICLLFIIFCNNYIYHEILFTLIFLSPFYMLIFIILSDKIYQVHFIKLIKFDLRYNEVDAIVNFQGTDDNSESVNITMPEINR